jgi:uncharacterized protein YjbK
MKKTIFFLFILTFNISYASDVLGNKPNIEHQIRLCDDDLSIIQKLNLKLQNNTNNQEKNFQTYYIETQNRSYEALKWSIRIRVKANKTEITVKKKSLPSEKLENKYANIICEYDLHGDLKEYSCKLNSEINNDEFKKILSGKKNWIDSLDSTQSQFLKDYQALFAEAKVYGSLINKRFQWNEDPFGLITIDLNHLNKDKTISFNEASIRYSPDQAQELGPLFENFIKLAQIKTCDDQRDWPVNKFDLFEILN